MQGIFNILKPPGMTSHDVVNFIRKILRIKKIGHGGTLDPAAAGVLPLFIGKATKFIEFFEGNDKQYIAELTFGITTETGDVQGKIIERKDVLVKEEHFKQILKTFEGKIQQIPPMYSAVHYQGKKLYELARQGISVSRSPRIVEIYSIDLIDFRRKTALIKVSCSKGTYIRTLCEDIGAKLGCGAYLSCLIRTRSGPFSLKNAKTLEEIQEAAEKDDFSDILLPIESCLNFENVELELDDERIFYKGNTLLVKSKLKSYNNKDYVKVFNKGKFLGVAKVENKNDTHVLRVMKSLI